MPFGAKTVSARPVLPKFVEVPHVILIVFCGLFLSSCAEVGDYCPKPSEAKGVVKGVSFSKSVVVLNAQDSTEKHNLGFRGITVDYHEFTQAVVDALIEELKANGATGAGSPERTLYVAVKEVRMVPGEGDRGYIDAQVKTGTGRIEVFRKSRISIGSPLNRGNRPTATLKAAFRELVKSILESKAIQDYIENG